MKQSHRYSAPIALALSVLACGASAQMVYRVIGPDGKLTFSDKPPLSDNKTKVQAVSAAPAAGTSTPGLPFELKLIADRFPVVLYTGSDCAPCTAGRALLVNRGIPFSERSVKTDEDAAALQRSTGENMLPQLRIGQQRLKGYSASEWTQNLDAAGYPQQSALPSTYKYATATPLAGTDKFARPKPPEMAQPAPAAPAPSAQNNGPTPANPAGIQF